MPSNLGTSQGTKDLSRTLLTRRLVTLNLLRFDGRTAEKEMQIT